MDWLAETPAPRMALDIDGARRKGRRKRRLRAYSVVAGCAAVVLAAGLAIPAALGPDEQEATGMVDRQHNPLVAKASFGWLPEVITGVEYGVGAHGDYALAESGRGSSRR
ncbi:hypothetical protein [Prauserella endophytica]|uniref:hypothetical protein n=1 Tax=Prauserella endophytica TaxID=1592324 RepID=UPI001E4D0FE8|nr:hypothetical protein [Prauserella endophytica]